MSRATSIRPPRIAGWLVGLATSSEQAELIRGDLLEEFSALTSQSGVDYASRWYWRQSVKTTIHLIASGFPVIAGAVIGGCLLLALLRFLTFNGARELLLEHGDRVYAHINAHVFWLLYSTLIPALIEPFLIGCIVAVATKGKELIVTIALSIAFVGPGLVQFVNFTLKHRDYWSVHNTFRWQPLVFIFVTPVVIAISGGIVREIRSVMSRRRSVAA